jgi:hypothetical protein
MDLISEIKICDNDSGLAQGLNIYQRPRVSRWRNGGFHDSTAEMSDALL